MKTAKNVIVKVFWSALRTVLPNTKLKFKSCLIKY